MQKFKTCPVCGAKFKICATCEDSSIPSWKKHSDSFEHFDIYTTVILYTRNVIDKEEAAKRLSGYVVKGYRESIQKYLDEIFAVDTPTQIDVEDVDIPMPKKRRRNKEAVFGQDEAQ